MDSIISEGDAFLSRYNENNAAVFFSFLFETVCGSVTREEIRNLSLTPSNKKLTFI